MCETAWHRERAEAAWNEAVFAAIGAAALMSSEWSPELGGAVREAWADVVFLQDAAKRLEVDYAQHLAGC